MSCPETVNGPYVELVPTELPEDMILSVKLLRQHVNWLENKELKFTFTGVTVVFANVILMVPIRFLQRANNHIDRSRF